MHTTDSIRSTPAPAERLFWSAFFAVGAIRLLLAAVVPLTSDEAYFVQWGRHLDYGYYDHGAMTGWWMWAMLHLGDAPWILRLPAVLTGQFVGWVLWILLRPLDRERAAWAATLFAVSPVSVLCFLITTDTPLLFFSSLAVLLTAHGVRRDAPWSHLAAGLALGLAFLSKYFAVLLGLAFAVLLLGCLGRPRVRALLLTLAGVVPGVAVNVAWNHHHAWTNVLFNVYTRHSDNQFDPASAPAYLAALALLLGPGVIIAWIRRDRGRRRDWGALWREMRADGTIVPVVAAVVPLAAFLVVSIFNRIGVHWVLSFVPFLTALFYACFDAAGLRGMARSTAIYSAVFVGLILAAFTFPVQWAQGHRSAMTIVLARHPEAITALVEPYRETHRIATPSYAKSALLAYHLGIHVPVLGFGSHHGRQDDLLSDIRTWNGRNFVIVTNRDRDIPRTQRWFARTELRTLDVHGANVHLILGEEFDYERYREEVLKTSAESFYTMPPWLARISPSNFFRERYGL